MKSGISSVVRVPVFQTGRRGFKSLIPLTNHTKAGEIRKDVPGAGFKPYTNMEPDYEKNDDIDFYALGLAEREKMLQGK